MNEEWPPAWLGWDETDAERRQRYIRRMDAQVKAAQERIRRSERLTAADFAVTVNIRD